jgi:hypothetical protein
MQITPFERSVVLSSAAWLALPHFAMLSHKMIFGKTKLMNMKHMF